MAEGKCLLGTALLFMLLVCTEAGVLRNSTTQQHVMTVSERLELANKDLGGDVLTRHVGGIKRTRRNEAACVITNCKWPRSSDGKVYVPYVIDDSYSVSVKNDITIAMGTFSSTCIRFTPRIYERDYLYILSVKDYGCRSHVGRIGGTQQLFLEESLCIDVGVIQHELLHALGFQHEHQRSDRDDYIRVLWENIREEFKYAFVKLDTLNWTPYDYNSIMHYGRFAASEDGLPTMKAVPYDVPFGTATRMTQNDIYRVKQLYCI